MRRLFSLLGDLIFYASRSRLERELAARPELADQAFYESYYRSSGIPEDIPIRIRKVYVEQLGDCWRSVRPGNKVCEICPDVDLAEMLYEIQDEFGFNIPYADMKKMDGTFDGIVRYVASQRQSAP
jgi:hypothetical protein